MRRKLGQTHDLKHPPFAAAITPEHRHRGTREQVGERIVESKRIFLSPFHRRIHGSRLLQRAGHPRECRVANRGSGGQ